MRVAPDNDSREQNRRLCALFASFSAEEPSMRRKANEEREFQALIEPYAGYFELPFEVFVVLFLICLDQVDTITGLSGADELPVTLVAVNDTLTGALEEELEDDDMKVIIGVLWATLSQVQAIDLFGVSLSELIDRARAGDRLALFRAIAVDRSVVACPTVARRIALAEAQGDESFMDQLARAIRSKAPACSEPEQNTLPMMLERLLERTYPQPLTKKRIAEMLAVNADRFSPASDYSFSALKQFVERHRLRVGN